MPSLSEWTNIIVAFGAMAQVGLGWAVWRVSARLHQLQRDQFAAQGPVFRLYFNGFQNRPRDPKNEMLTFRMTVANEGRTDARIASFGLLVKESKGKDARSEQSFTLVPIEHVKWSNEKGKVPRPLFPNVFADSGRDSRNDFFLPKNDSRSFIAYLPANGGYEKWTKVRIHAAPIGGVEGAIDLEWTLFWLDYPDSDA